LANFAYVPLEYEPLLLYFVIFFHHFLHFILQAFQLGPHDRDLLETGQVLHPCRTPSAGLLDQQQTLLEEMQSLLNLLNQTAKHSSGLIGLIQRFDQFGSDVDWRQGLEGRAGQSMRVKQSVHFFLGGEMGEAVVRPLRCKMGNFSWGSVLPHSLIPE
jgi:hypothetical protein